MAGSYTNPFHGELETSLGFGSYLLRDHFHGAQDLVASVHTLWRTRLSRTASFISDFLHG